MASTLLFSQGELFSCLQLALGLVFIPPIVGGITLILKNTGPLVALYLYFFILVLSLFMLTIYPIVIAPLFNKFTPLQPGPLRYVHPIHYNFLQIHKDMTCTLVSFWWLVCSVHLQPAQSKLADQVNATVSHINQ